MVPGASYTTVEQAQLNVSNPALHPEFHGPSTVLTVDAQPFWRVASDSPDDQGYHWNLNAESYFLIGKGLGDNMVNLLSAP